MLFFFFYYQEGEEEKVREITKAYMGRRRVGRGKSAFVSLHYFFSTHKTAGSIKHGKGRERKSLFMFMKERKYPYCKRRRKGDGSVQREGQ